MKGRAMKFPGVSLPKPGGIKIGGLGAPKLRGAPGLPKAPSAGNVRPHLAGVSTHRLSLRGKSAYPAAGPTAFNTPDAVAGPAQAFAGGAGAPGAAQGDLGE